MSKMCKHVHVQVVIYDLHDADFEELELLGDGRSGFTKSVGGSTTEFK